MEDLKERMKNAFGAGMQIMVGIEVGATETKLHKWAYSGGSCPAESPAMDAALKKYGF